MTTKRMKRTLPLDLTAFAVRAQYISAVDHEEAFELRNATVNYRDRNHEWGQVVDIKVRGTKVRPGDQDKEILDYVQLYNTEFWMHGGMMVLRGFAQIVVKDGEKLDKNYGSPEAPMRHVKVFLTPEACLNANGEWRDGKD